MYASFRPTGLPAVAPSLTGVAGLSRGRIPQAALDVLYSYCLTWCQTAEIDSKTDCTGLVGPLKEIPIEESKDHGVSRVVTSRMTSHLIPQTSCSIPLSAGSRSSLPC